MTACGPGTATNTTPSSATPVQPASTSSTSTAPAPSSTSTSASPSTSSTSTPPSSTTTTADANSPAAGGQLTPLTGSATDDVFGNSITVAGYAVIPGNAFPPDVVSKYVILDGGSVLVVKATLTAATTTKYSVTGFPDTLSVGDKVSPYGAFGVPDPINAAVEAMGFAPVLDPVLDGPGEGYLVTAFNHNVSLPATITMKRSAAGVSDGTTIPAQTWTVATIG